MRHQCAKPGIGPKSSSTYRRAETASHQEGGSLLELSLGRQNMQSVSVDTAQTQALPFRGLPTPTPGSNQFRATPSPIRLHPWKSSIRFYLRPTQLRVPPYPIPPQPCPPHLTTTGRGLAVDHLLARGPEDKATRKRSSAPPHIHFHYLLASGGGVEIVQHPEMGGDLSSFILSLKSTSHSPFLGSCKRRK